MYNGYHVFEGIAEEYGLNYHIIKARSKKRAFEIMTECMKKMHPSRFYYIRFVNLDNELIKPIIDRCKNTQECHCIDMIKSFNYIYVEDKEE